MENFHDNVNESFNYDKGIKVGDIITAYHSGYHRVTKVVPRYQTDDPSLPSYMWEYSETPAPGFKRISSVIEYEQVLTSKMKKSPKRKNRCDAFYCKSVSLENAIKRQDDEITSIKTGYGTLIDIIKESQCLNPS